MVFTKVETIKMIDFSNWSTANAYELITLHDDIFLDALDDSCTHNLRSLIELCLVRATESMESEEIEVNLINFKELRNALSMSLAA